MRRRDPAAAQVFLSGLRTLVPALARRWGISELSPLSGRAVSAVCAGVRGVDEVVLKVPVTAAAGAAEVAQLEAWTRAGRSGVRRWPEVLEFDADSGAFVMGRLSGSPAHRSGVRFEERFAEGVEGFLEVVAATPAPGGLPAPADLLVAPMFAAASLLAETAALPRWRAVFADRHGDLTGLGARVVACHGDLWAGNLLVDPADGGVWVLDPSPCAAPVEFDVARVAVDGWAGPGFDRRAERLCAALGADREVVERAAAVLLCAQVFTFARHGWDPAPIAAAVGDAAGTLGLDVEALDGDDWALVAPR